MNKVTCVRRRHKKWARFTASECRHKDCLAAAVARRIQGPVTPGMQYTAGALKAMYDDYARNVLQQQAQATTVRIAEGLQNVYQWKAQQMLLPQTAEEEVQDEADSKVSRKTDRG